MSSMNRRDFLRRTAAGSVSAAVAYHVAESSVSAFTPPADRLRIGVVGVAGRGGANLNGVAGEDIVALCDVDTNRAGPARQRFPNARFFEDYRRMLDQVNLDAVVVSTPDHTHAVAANAAMEAGTHLYCEKPMAHSVHEVRTMIRTAAQRNVKTQLGTQIHAGENYRRVVEIIRAGTLGEIRRVHVWVNRRPEAGRRSQNETPIPNGLDYDLWLGPAPYRHYNQSHTHFKWRWWWDFGGGVLADMGCHYMDLAHWALNLRTPDSISANGQVLYQGDNSVPSKLQVDYQYPARGNHPAVHLTWYHGVAGPNLNNQVRYPGYSSGVLFEGEDNKKLVAGYRQYRLLPENQFENFQRPQPTIPRSVGHHREWLEAIRNNGETTCSFDYSGPLTVSVLLGNVAYRANRQIQWDDEMGRVTNTRAADEFIQREYRNGWSL